MSYPAELTDKEFNATKAGSCLEEQNMSANHAIVVDPSVILMKLIAWFHRPFRKSVFQFWMAHVLYLENWQSNWYSKSQEVKI
jgi:hypothetical protein